MFHKFIKIILPSIVAFTIIMKTTESLSLYKRHLQKRMIVDNDSNMQEKLRNSTTAWVVLFYYRFHNYSSNLLTNWISLSNSIKEWNDVVTPLVIDCISPRARNLCKENGARNSSSIQYFSPGDSYGKGHELTMIDTIKNIKIGIIDNLIKDQKRGIGRTWPNLLPFSGSSPKDGLAHVSSTPGYFIFLFEEVTSFLASEIILDLHKREYLEVRRVTEDNQLFCSKYNVTKFPQLVIFSKKKDQIQRNSSFPVITDLVENLQEYMRSKGIVYIPDQKILERLG